MDPTSPAPQPAAPSITDALNSADRISLADLPKILIDQLQSWLELAVRMLPNLVVALLLFVLAWFVARGAASLARRTLDRLSHNVEVNRLLEVVTRVSLTALGLFAALSVLNLDGVVTSLLAGVGVIGLALGFAFQDIAANFMSGVIMAISRPFKVGDLMKTGDFFGTVEGINLRTTLLRTPTGELVLIPNQQVYNNPLTNFTETDHRRVDLPVGVAYCDDLRGVKATVEQTLRGLSMADADRPVEVLYEGFGDSSINFQARFWIRARTQHDFLAARSEAIMSIKEALDAEGYTIPFPIRTLDFGAGVVGGERLDEVIDLRRQGGNGTAASSAARVSDAGSPST
ncbi:MAG: mechanosensitive ion channel family protein [Myxococcota bacterium]